MRIECEAEVSIRQPEKVMGLARALYKGLVGISQTKRPHDSVPMTLFGRWDGASARTFGAICWWSVYRWSPPHCGVCSGSEYQEMPAQAAMRLSRCRAGCGCCSRLVSFLLPPIAFSPQACKMRAGSLASSHSSTTSFHTPEFCGFCGRRFRRIKRHRKRTFFAFWLLRSLNMPRLMNPLSASICRFYRSCWIYYISLLHQKGIQRYYRNIKKLEI